MRFYLFQGKNAQPAFRQGGLVRSMCMNCELSSCLAAWRISERIARATVSGAALLCNVAFSLGNKEHPTATNPDLIYTTRGCWSSVRVVRFMGFGPYRTSTPFRFARSKLLANNGKLFESLTELPQGSSSSPRTKIAPFRRYFCNRGDGGIRTLEGF